MDSTIGNIHKFLGGHRGRLYHQNSTLKSWKPRFFVLERKRIKIYADETLFRINGEVVVNEGTMVYDVPGEIEGRKFLFYVGSKDAASPDDVLYLSAHSRRDKMEWMEAIMDAVHNGFKLVNQPELWLDAFYPKVDLSISFGSVNAEYGNMLKPQMVESPPTVVLRLADPNLIYSLILVDLDSIYASEENKTVFLHWGVVNIQGSDISTGVEVAPYLSPAPEYDSGLHRFFFLLFTQNFILTNAQIMETAEAFQQREQFSYLDWVRSRNLGDPVGLNGFYAGWEDYCRVLHEKQNYQPPDKYLIARQDAFLQREAEAIWVEDAKLQLFQDLTLSDLFPANVDVSAGPVGSIAMTVQYEDEMVGGGAAIAAGLVRKEPLVSFTPHQAEISGFVAGTNAIAVDFGLYTLLMVDADAGLEGGGTTKGVQEYVHWVVMNIPQANINEGVTVLPYKAPAPMYGSGLHRYVFSLYKQKKAFTQQQVDTSRAFFARRSGIKSYDWVRSFSAALLNVPVALEAFLCEWDESVGDGDGRDGRTSTVSRRGSEDDAHSMRSHHSAGSSVRSRRREDAEGGTESEQDSSASSRRSAPRAGKGRPVDSRRQEPPQRAAASVQSAPPPVTAAASPAVAEAPLRTSLGSLLMDADHGLIEPHESPERFAGAKSSTQAPDNATKVPAYRLQHAGGESEDLTRHKERKAAHSVDTTPLPDSDSKTIFADFEPRKKPSPRPTPAPTAPAPASASAPAVKASPTPASKSAPERVAPNVPPRAAAPPPPPAPQPTAQQPAYTPLKLKSALRPSPSPEKLPAPAVYESSPPPSPRSLHSAEDGSLSRRSNQPRPSDDVEWLREQEEKEKREKKKLLQKQREAELERFEQARILEEQRRREAAQQEERRRLAKQQEEEMDRLMEEKRRKAKADQEKIRKQEEMRRAMQEHEEAEAERVRLQESRAETERQKVQQEQAEAQRRQEARQAEEQRRALQRQQEEAAAEAEQKRLAEERAADEKRRQKQQRAEEEAEQQRQAEAQRLEAQRRVKLQQLARQEEDERQRQLQQADDRDRTEDTTRQTKQSASPRPSPQPLAPAIKLRTSFGNVVVDSNRGLIEAPPPARYGGGNSTRSDPSQELQSGSSESNFETNHHSEFENESVLSALSSGTSVASKLQRSVSFATIISTTSDDSYWIDADDPSDNEREKRDRERRERRLRKERERENTRYMEQQMLESIESEEMRRLRMKELEEERLRKEAAEVKARQQRLWEEQQREVERLQQERLAAAEAARELQERQQREREEEQATLDLLRREEEEARRQQELDEAEARRLQEEQEYEEQMRILHVQLEEEHSVHMPAGTENEEEHDDNWGGYDGEHDSGIHHDVVNHGGEDEESPDEVVEAYHEGHLNFESSSTHEYRSAQLIEEHRQYFDDKDEKDSGGGRSGGGTVVDDEHDAGDIPQPPAEEKPASPARSVTQPLQKSSPVSSPARSVQSSATSAYTAPLPSPATAATAATDSSSSSAPTFSSAHYEPQPQSNRERADSESSSKLSGEAAPAPPTSPRGPPGSPLSRGKSIDRINQIAEGVNRARNSGDLCKVFDITTKSIFDGDRLKKKFTTDFMMKDSAVWIDPQKRSLHWGKKPLDASTSKFFLLEPYTKSNPNLPPHLRPAGENRGTCKSVQLVDSTTFKVTLWSDDVFLGKLAGDNAAEKTNDWVKVINSFQRRV